MDIPTLSLVWALLQLPQLCLLQRSVTTCLTYDGRAGQQVEIKACKVLLDHLKGDKPTREQIKYVKKFQVGWKGSTPVVCCPEEDFEDNSDTAPTFTTSTTTRKPTRLPPAQTTDTIQDVGKHKNRKLLPAICGGGIESKITNGDKTDLFEFPWMALLGYQTDRGIHYYCGGTLINSLYVLTAAHCIVNTKSRRLSVVRLGEHDLDSTKDCTNDLGCAPPVQDIIILESTRHPQYDEENLANDIALIRLKKSATTTKGVTPICLPVGEEQRENVEKRRMVVTGWGTTENGTDSSILLKIRTQIVSSQRCAQTYRLPSGSSTKLLCSGGGFDGKAACRGDSGGPLQDVGLLGGGAVGFIQYGVISFGPESCATIDRPVVYTKVGFYMQWILDTMKP